MKLSARERTLATVVGVALFIFLNILLLGKFSQKNAALHTELVQQRLEWAGMKDLLTQQSMWAARDAALTVKQPKLSNENAAGVELWDMINQLAKRHSITLTNPVFGGVTKTQWYSSVPVSVDTESSWPELIAFLYTLQQPDQFIVCEAANISVDPSDQTKMVGHFKISRWYAP
jgi:hypothetical protein